MTTTEPPFLDLPNPPPTAAAAIRAVYAAFARYPRPAGPFCRQCFSEAEEALVLAQVPVRAADPAAFGRIYGEALACSVDEEGFMYFLPRALETRFFAHGIQGFPADMVDAGTLTLPADERTAVAGAIARAATDFFATGRVLPLGPQRGPPKAVGNGVPNIGRELVRGLLAVRVAPRQVFQWLLRMRSWRPFMALLALVEDGVFRARPGHPGLDGTAPADLLNEIARIDLCQVVRLEQFKEILALTTALLTPYRVERLTDRYLYIAARAEAADRDAVLIALRQALARCEATPPER